MKVLILGYSDLVNRKVLPAISKLENIESIDVATKTGIVKSFKKLNNVFRDYSKAILLSDAEIVYVFLPNNLHYKYSKYSIENNKSVIVDKPAVLNSNEFQILNSLVKANNLFISMSCVFHFHKAWDQFKLISNSKNLEGTLIVEFTIPKLIKSNIRMSQNLKGGAINDMAIYASMAGLLFWDKPSKETKIYKFKNKSVVERFSILANYGSGKNLIGNFGFNQIYSNKVTFSGREIRAEYDRVFSPPNSYNSKIYISKKNTKKKIEIGKDDTFINYFKYIIKNEKNNKKLINDDFKKYNLEYLRVLENNEKT